MALDRRPGPARQRGPRRVGLPASRLRAGTGGSPVRLIGEGTHAPRRGARRHGLLGAPLVIAAAAALLAPGAAFSEDADPALVADGADLSARVAAGPVVVLALVEKDGGKARVAIERVYRGEGLGERLRIDARQSNAVRPLGTPLFRVDEGERAVFVLRPAVDLRQRPLGPDVFEPATGHRSRIPIPGEGEDALLDAVESVIYFQDTADRGLAEAGLVDWLTGRNPWLVDVALTQAARHALAGPDWVPGLLELTRDASPWRRTRAVRALGLAIARGRLDRPTRFRRGSPLAAEEANETLRASREAIIRLARSDGDATVRAAAVRQLARSADEQAVEVLKTISMDDPSQDVRYEAAAGLRRAQGGTR